MFLKNLLNTPDYISGTSESGDFIRLSSNENNYGPSPEVIKTLENIVKNVHSYPHHYYATLKEVVANFNKVKNSNVFLGNGSDEIFFYLFMIFVSPQDSVVSIEKTFTYYKIISNIIGAEFVEAKRNKDFSISTENIISSVNRNTKMVIFPSPDNPTGYVITYNQLRSILENVPKSCVVVFDEAYFQFYFGTLKSDVCSLIEKYDNLVVVRTFSKLYALAGLRLGYAISSEGIVSLYEKIRQPFNISIFAEKAGISAISSIEYYEKILKIILVQRDFLSRKLKEMGFETFENTYGNFLFVRHKDIKLSEKLKEKGILIRQLVSFGYEPDFYRITVGTERENLILLKKLEEILL